MKVKRIGLAHFGVHAHLVLDLPEHGLVLVHGPNGAGKSTILEALAGLWGENLRGEKPLTVDGSRVAVELDDGATIRRVFGKTRNRVEVVLDGQEHHPATATKGAELVESLLGPWEAWRRTHVLSVHDAQHFSLATDRTRKEVIEGLLGLGRFETANRRAAECLRDVRAAQRGAMTKHAAVASTVDAARRHLARLDALVGTSTATPLCPPEVVASALAALHDEVRARSGELGAIDARLASLRSTPPEHCPTCRQPWPAAVDRSAVAQEIATLLERRASLERLRAAAEADRCSLQAQEQQRAHVEAVRAAAEARGRAQAELAAAETALAESEAAFALAEHEVLAAEFVAEVFSPAGVRADLLADCLVRLGDAATRWVGRISRGWEVDLPLGKVGRQVDAIQLLVGPAHAKRSYKACSNGERRRVDVGLCLALRELGSRAGREQAGTLWADDLFDGLDEVGAQALAEVLREEAQRTSVVVLAPSLAVAGLLRPDLVVDIRAGVT